MLRGYVGFAGEKKQFFSIFFLIDNTNIMLYNYYIYLYRL